MRQSFRPIFALAALAVGALTLAPAAQAGTYNLEIARGTIDVAQDNRDAMTINGTVPGPVLRFKEGEELTINVANRMDVDTSIHWHGLLLPFQFDGVPGVSFPGIKSGETFVYDIPALRQSGTYWWHSHSGLQEQAGHYGPIVVEPSGQDAVQVDRDYVLLLSEFTPLHPHTIMDKLKKGEGYFNYNQNRPHYKINRTKHINENQVPRARMTLTVTKTFSTSTTTETDRTTK